MTILKSSLCLFQDGVWSDFKIDGVSGAVRISKDLDIGKKKEYFLSVRAKVRKIKHVILAVAQSQSLAGVHGGI